MDFLTKAVEKAFGHKTSIIAVLVENLSKPQLPRSHKEIHASDITKDFFCPRMILLLDALNLHKKDEYPDPAMAATWDVGNMTADLVRENWLGDVAIGNWTCLKCGTSYTLSRKPPIKELTVNCLHVWRYREMQFVSESLGFEGSLDVLLDLGGPKYMVCELKIMAPEHFAKITAPLAEHRLRTNLYMRLVESSGSSFGYDRINTQRAKVLYVSRGYGKKHEATGIILPFKEFDVERNDDDLKVPLERALEVKTSRKLNILPARVCSVSYAPEAKGCPVAQQCFSGKYQTGATLPIPGDKSTKVIS